MSQLSSSELPCRAVARKLRKNLKAADHILARFAAGEPEVNAHAIRKKLKKAASLLAMMRVDLGEQRHARQTRKLRRIARALAGRRQAEAMVEIIAKLRDDCSSPSEKAALQALEARLLGTLDQVRAKPPEFGELADLRRKIANLRRKSRRWRLSERNPSRLIEAMTVSYRRARRLIARGLSSGSAKTLHEARKSVIHHLHHIEFVTPLWPAILGPLAGELFAFRTLLGDLNDFDELAREVKRNAAVPLGNDQARLCLLAIRRQRCRFVKMAARRAMVLFADKPRAFASRTDVLWRAAAT